MTWQDKRISHLIAGVGQTLAGTKYSTWTSRVATGDASQATDANRPTRSETKVLGREGVVFDNASSCWMQIADIHTNLSGATPSYAFGMLVTINTAGLDQFFIGAGSSNDEFRAIRSNGSNRLEAISRFTGNANQLAAIGSSSYLAAKAYAMVVSVSGTSVKGIARPLDASADATGTGTLTLAGSPTLEVGIIGGRYINGGPTNHAAITIHDAVVFDDALTGDVTDEAGGGEVWDLIDYLTSTLVLTPRYEIYRRPTLGGTDELVDQVDGSTLTYTLTGQAADSSYYYHVKAVSACGVRDVDGVPARLRRVAFDGDAELIPPTPNVPIDVTLTPYAGGGVTLDFGYRATDQEVAPDHFNIYVATGATAFDYDTVDHTQDYAGARYTVDLGTLSDTTTVRVEVRSATSGGDESASSAQATATADATAPPAPASLTAELV